MKWLGRAGQVLAGVIAALVITELVFWWRDDGAFPHVNLYVADRELGVRLEPDAEQNIAFGGNPRTSIQINRAGYRGANWPAPGKDEILVVGDSQVFGLGVEELDTFSAQLAKLTGRPVINAGVPTYGPAEYTAVVRELIARRRPRTVVYTINFVNDLFEWKRPNRERHAVWDGWAVRIETAPRDVSQFPGRRWLFSRSHTVYALRGWLHDRRDDESSGFASEGTWRDLVEIGQDTGVHHSTAAAERAKARRATEAREDQLREQQRQTDRKLDSLLAGLADGELGDEDGGNHAALQAASAHPGDIVYIQDGLSESSRDLPVTAELIRRGVRVRNRLLARARQRAGGRHGELDAVLRERDELAGQRAAADTIALPVERVPSVLEPAIAEVRALCEDNGAELVVLALPIDVQVSPREWKKYGVAQPIDMAPTRILIDDLVAGTTAMGVRAVDATPPLAAVDGAFLDHDIHMTRAGHAAVAKALASAIAGPAPVKAPAAGLPAGRTRVPDPDKWLTTPEAIVAGSTDARCETIRIAEWLRVTCVHGHGEQPTAIEIVSGSTGEELTVESPDAVTLVAPLERGRDLAVDFFWKDRRQRLVAAWPADADKPRIGFEAAQAAGRTFAIGKGDARLCQCEIALRRLADPLYTRRGQVDCQQLYGEATDDCMATYGDDCAALLACARGDAVAPPACPAGEANAGATGHCFALCDAAHPCRRGTCTPWQGSGICR